MLVFDSDYIRVITDVKTVVSILVLVDVGLRHDIAHCCHRGINVSILVLVDVGLRR